MLFLVRARSRSRHGRAMLICQASWELGRIQQPPPICSWWTSRVSPSCISSCVCVSALRPLVVFTIFRATLCLTHHLGVVGRVDSGAVEEEADASEGLALTLAEGVHELLQLGCALDLEEDLVVVVGHLDVEVLGLLGSLVLVGGGGRGWRRRHGEGGAKVVSGRVVWIFVDEGAQVSQAEETVLRWGMSAQMSVRVRRQLSERLCDANTVFVSPANRIAGSLTWYWQLGV